MLSLGFFCWTKRFSYIKHSNFSLTFLLRNVLKRMVYPSLVTIFVPLLVGDKVMFSNSGVTVCIHHCVAKGVGGCSRHNPYHTGHI